MTSPRLDAASDLAFERLEEADNDLSRVASPYREVAIVSAAQGVIDNGGFRYFFGSDWPEQPPYALFTEAYRQIGAQDYASALSKAAALFPFDAPEAAEDARRVFLEGGGGDEIEALEKGCSSDVWKLLETFVIGHAHAFESK